MNRTAIIAYKVALATPVALWVLIAFPLTPKPRLALLWATQRTGGCSLDASLHSDTQEESLRQLAHEIYQRMKLVRHDGAFDLYDTPDGPWWVNKGDKFLNFMLAEQRHEIYGASAAGVQLGDIVLDCGANIGVFTRTALRRGARLVVAIEPAPSTAECLRRNFAGEISKGQVVVVSEGVWDKTGQLPMHEIHPENAGANSLVKNIAGSRSFSVPLTTIDLLVARLHLARVDFIKMDIEGAEKQALRGATATIRRDRPRMAISSEHLDDDVTAIPVVLRSILPAYTERGADCSDASLSVRPSVLLFTAKR